MSVVIIMRGHAGSGKSTFVDDFIQYSDDDSYKTCVSADDFFYDEKEKYNFDHNKLGKAHAQCFSDFCGLLRTGIFEYIFVDNTNIKKEHYEKYIKAAKEHGYEVFQKVMTENYSSIHNVPPSVIERMKEQFEIDGELPHFRNTQ